MISRSFFIGIFLIVGGGALYLGGQFFFKLHQYFLLSTSAPAKVSDWNVIEKNGKFTLEARYKFETQGGVVEGTFSFPKPVYQNPYLAEDLIKIWAEKSWEIWYHPKAPYGATLEKNFPIKKGFQFGLSLVAIVYFAFLKIYVKRMHAAQGESEKPPL